MADPYASYRAREKAGQEFFSQWPRPQVTELGANLGSNRVEVVPPIFSTRVSPEDGFRLTGNARVDTMHEELRERETRFANLSRQYDEQFAFAIEHGPTVVAPNPTFSQQLFDETGLTMPGLNTNNPFFDETGLATPGLNTNNPLSVPRAADIDEAIRRNPYLRVLHKEQKKEWGKIAGLLKTLSRGLHARSSYQAGRKQRATLLDEENATLSRRTLVGA